MLLRETFAVGPLACNCTILGCDDDHKAVIIDPGCWPGNDLRRVREVIAANHLEVVAIVHTHAHIDHMYGTADVHAEHGGELSMHRADLPLYQAINWQGQMLGWRPMTILPIGRSLDEGDIVTFGSHSLEVVHTPGHTPGSICLQLGGRDVPRLLFSGDTLFRRSIGRTDLPGGDPGAITHSIRTKLYPLDPDTRVITGHGPHTTLGEEARHNPFVPR